MRVLLRVGRTDRWPALPCLGRRARPAHWSIRQRSGPPLWRSLPWS